MAKQYWTSEYNMQSMREGWLLTNDSEDRFTIAKLDDPCSVPELGYEKPIFACDDEAFAHVMKQAMAGSTMHQLSLVLYGHDFNDLVELPSWFGPLVSPFSDSVLRTRASIARQPEASMRGLLAAIHRTMWPDGCTPDDSWSPDTLQDIADHFNDYGMVPGDSDIDDDSSEDDSGERWAMYDDDAEKFIGITYKSYAEALADIEPQLDVRIVKVDV